MKKTAQFIRTTIVASLFGLVLASCSEEVENRGYITKFSDFSKIQAGVSTKSDVIQELGSPTTTSLFGEETWYYLGKEQTKETFFEPEIRKYDGYEITFKGNVVSSINRKEEKDLREIEVSEDSTHTTGNEITVWQQLFGNLGKFNPASKQQRVGVTPGSSGPGRY
jgi:outer membrane protein assembly factor BamE (lipoprotein component of BamABCDE complex)